MDWDGIYNREMRAAMEALEPHAVSAYGPEHYRHVALSRLAFDLVEYSIDCTTLSESDIAEYFSAYRIDSDAGDGDDRFD